MNFISSTSPLLLLTNLSQVVIVDSDCSGLLLVVIDSDCSYCIELIVAMTETEEVGNSFSVAVGIEVVKACFSAATLACLFSNAACFYAFKSR